MAVGLELSTSALPTKPVAPVTATTIVVFCSATGASSAEARTREVDARSVRRAGCAEAPRRGAAARERLESAGEACTAVAAVMIIATVKVRPREPCLRTVVASHTVE